MDTHISKINMALAYSSSRFGSALHSSISQNFLRLTLMARQRRANQIHSNLHMYRIYLWEKYSLRMGTTSFWSVFSHDFFDTHINVYLKLAEQILGCGRALPPRDEDTPIAIFSLISLRSWPGIRSVKRCPRYWQNVPRLL